MKLTASQRMDLDNIDLSIVFFERELCGLRNKYRKANIRRDLDFLYKRRATLLESVPASGAGDGAPPSRTLQQSQNAETAFAQKAGASSGDNSEQASPARAVKRVVSGAGALLFCCIFLAGCAPAPDTPLGVQMPDKTQGRIEISRIGVIQDDLAYQYRRGIYLIRDRQSGQEYIGVSGIGITEVGMHKTGKHWSEDER